MQSFTYSSSGPRSSNQDSMSIIHIKNRGHFLCVADGVGGSNGGQEASDLAIKIFISHLRNVNLSMNDALLLVHKELQAVAKTNKNLAGMSTTFTAALLDKMSLRTVHCGDSRLYVLRKNKVIQLSKDHTEVAKYLEEGKLTKEEALVYPRKNIIYSSLGGSSSPVVDEFIFSLEPKDKVVLLTDGFYEAVSKKIFRDISVASHNIKEFGNKLVEYINTAETTDNFTIVAVEIS